MKRNHVVIAVGLVGALSGAWLAQAFPRATRPSLSFTGTLKQGGQALAGPRALRFGFKKGLAEICNVPVGGVMPEAGTGRFSVEIPLEACPAGLFDGADVTVDVSVDGELIAANQAIHPVPYAKYADLAAGVAPAPTRAFSRSLPTTDVIATDWTTVATWEPALPGNRIVVTNLEMNMQGGGATMTNPPTGSGRFRFELTYADGSTAMSAEYSTRIYYAIGTPGRGAQYTFSGPLMRCAPDVVKVRLEARSNGTGPLTMSGSLTGQELPPMALPRCRLFSASRPVPVETATYTEVATFDAPPGVVWTPRQIRVSFDFDPSTTDNTAGMVRATLFFRDQGPPVTYEGQVGTPYAVFGILGTVTLPVVDGFVAEVERIVIETKLTMGAGKPAIAAVDVYEFDARR